MPGHRLPNSSVDAVLRDAEANGSSARRDTALSALFGVTARTLRNVRERAATRQSPYARASPGRPPLLTRAEVEVIRAACDTECAGTLQDVATFIEREFHKHVAVNTLQAIMARARISWKRVQRRSADRDPQARALFAARMAAIDMRQCVFVDETGFTRTTAIRRHGWASVGRRAVATTLGRGVRFVHLTLILGINYRGVVGYTIVRGGAKTANFADFIYECILPRVNFETGENTIMVLDNCSIHHNRYEIEEMELRGLQLIFLPAYSPDFNPIEMVFSPLKQYLRRRYYAYMADPVRLIVAATSSITPLTCYNCIRHMPYALHFPTQQ